MDELLMKQVPNSIEAEQAVLGSMLIDARCIGDVLGAVKAEDFYSSTNREIFETIYSMFNYSMVIDPVTVLENMRSNGVYNERSSQYILELMDITPTAANVLEYAAIVKDKALLRGIAEAGSEINSLAMEGLGTASDILEASEKKIYALRQGRNTTGLEPVSGVLRDVYEQLSEAAKSGSRIPGLSTGLPDLDNVTMGLNNSDFILIASRPGMGKTSIALNIALNVAMVQHKKVAIFSLEMSREQLVTRLLSRAAMVPSQNLFTGRLTEQQWREVSAAAGPLSAADILIDDNSTL
ncbi:MAG: replicative DNA helicase, partial [Oscillospiraceae bacterium]|nr:replicative DNA helicase [Oscillospiraceae bacterium]